MADVSKELEAAAPETARDVLAACWLDDVSDGDGLSAEWALGIIRDYREAEHCGDCTKVPSTCFRCAIEEAFVGADATLAALDAAGFVLVPREPTEEMVQQAEAEEVASWSGDDDCNMPISDLGGSIPTTVWRAMLTAAPKP